MKRPSPHVAHAKAKRCGRPIQIYLSSIAKSQDENMYRVVMGQERWFSVVIRENYKVDAKAIEKLASRTPLPPVSLDSDWR